MSDLRFTGKTKDLLDAARRDGPSAAQRSRIWNGVALAPQLSLVVSTARDSLRPETVAASAAHAKAAASVAAALSAGKLLVLGAIAGSALTLGLGAVVWRGVVRQAPTASIAASDDGEGVAGSFPYEASAPRVPALTPDFGAPIFGETVDVASKPSLAEHKTIGATSPTPRGDDKAAFTKEVALFADARASLARGDASGALRSLDLASRVRSHSLEPEELALRSRALRAMGREDEAQRTDETLKARFPQSFLAQ